MNKRKQSSFCVQLLAVSLGVVVFAACGDRIANGQQYVSQDGHALDANMRVGSRGWNTRVRQDPLMPSSNLMITGNVRGGQSFQGLVPYQSVGELQTGLGVDVLSNFRRDSTGVMDLSASPSYQGYTPYVSSSRQVTGTYNNEIANTYHLSQGMTSPSQLNQPLRRLAPDHYRALRPISRLNNSLNVLSPRPIADPQDYSRAIGRAGWKTEAMLNLERERVKQQKAQIQAEESTSETEELISEPKDYNDQIFELLEAQSDAVNKQDAQTPLSSEEFYQAFQEELEEKRQADIAREKGREPAWGEGDSQTGAQGEERKPVPTGPLGLSDPAVTDKIAAINQDQYKHYMAQGESFMGKGRFYHAADAFGSAAFFNPQSGTAVLAKSHALLAAGELMSSAFYLDQALKVSPGLAAEAVDLESLLGGAQNLQKRLDDLKRWQERSGNPVLLFLKGYVLMKTGDSEEAETVLAKAAELQPELASAQVLLKSLGEGP